jgi:hypothetical protein
MELTGIRQKVFLDRYALKDKEGNLTEHTPEEMWKRVAWGISQNEKKKDRAHWEKEFYNSDSMNNYIRTKIIPDVDKFLKEKNLEWYDFDEVASREAMKSEVGSHSTIANLIYYENK